LVSQVNLIFTRSCPSELLQANSLVDSNSFYQQFSSYKPFSRATNIPAIISLFPLRFNLDKLDTPGNYWI